MKWSDVKGLVSEAAPLLGGLLGGPAGEMAGTLISKALGVPATPDAIVTELKNNPEALVKIKQIEAEREVELQKLFVAAEANRLTADTQQIQAVNQTMQVEAKSEHWAQWLWRPYWGFVAGTAFLVVCIFVLVLAYMGIAQKDHEAIKMIPDLVTSMAELFAIPGAILGVTAWHRGRLQRAQAGEQFQPLIMRGK